MLYVLSFKSTSSELGMGEKGLGHGEGVKSTLFVVRCILSSSKYLSIFTDWLSIFWLSLFNSKLLYALYSLNIFANCANWSLLSTSTNFCCSFSSLRSFSFCNIYDLMFKFDFAYEAISFALAFSNWMFFELDLEFEEDDFEELLLDLEDLGDFSEDFLKDDRIFDTKSIIVEFSLK